MKDDELLRNRTTARTMLSEVHQLVSSAQTEEDWAKLRGIGTDADVFLDLAKLWQDESLEKTIAAYETAVSMASDKEQDGPVDLRNVKLSSNLGAMFQAQGNVDTAERMYQEALQKLASEEGKEAEVLKTESAYNLGRAYEEGGEVVKASQWYQDVLRQHPEHMECEWCEVLRLRVC
jgi:RNA polymerase-associated protein CTR9